MDEAYASPDSDGHASLPSPTDTTFDFSDIPQRLRARQGAAHPIIESSSSFMQSENDDGDDEEDDLVSVTPRGASILMPSSSPVTENRSRVLAPVDANDPNSTRRPGRSAPGPILGQRENIDPKENNSQKLASNRGRTQLTGESSDDDSSVNPPTLPNVITISRSSTPDLSAPPGQIAVQRRRSTPAKVESPPSHQTPSNPHVTSKAPNRPDYLKWLSSDSYYGNTTADATNVGGTRSGHAARLQGARARGFWEKLGFCGDENSPISGGEIEFTNDEIQILGEELYRHSPFENGVSTRPLGRLEETSQESVNQDVGRVSDPGGAPSERIPFPVPPRPSSAPSAGTPRGEVGKRHGTRANSSDLSTIKDTGYQDTNAFNSTNPSTVIAVTKENGDTNQPPGDYIPPNLARSVFQPKSPITISLLENSEASSGPVSALGSRASDAESSAEGGDSVNPTGPGLGSKPSIVGSSPTDETEELLDSNQPRHSISGPAYKAAPLARVEGGSPEASSVKTAVPPPPSKHGYSEMRSERPSMDAVGRDNFSFLENPPQPSLFAPGPLATSRHQQDPQASQFAFPPHATSTPRNRYEPDFVTRLRLAGNVRRVSMNTPPSASTRSISGTEILADSPKFSSLGSGFDFPTEPLRYSNWEPDGVSLEFSPILPIDKPRKNGHEPPPNSTNVTPVPNNFGGGRPPEGKGRARSRSDPADTTAGLVRERRLFTPTRLNMKTPEGERERKSPHPQTLKAVNTHPLANSASLVGSNQERRDDDSEGSVSDDGNYGRLWSGFSEDLSFRRDLETTETVEANPEPRSLSFDNDIYQVDIPRSVGEESRGVSYDGDSSREPTRALPSRIAQADTLNDDILKILESNIGLESGPKVQISVDNSVTESLSAQENNVEALQKRILQLEELVKVFGKRDAEHTAIRGKQEATILHWNRRYIDAHQTARGLESEVEQLKKETRRVVEDREAQARSHSALIEQLNTEHREEVITHRRQASVGSEERIRHYETRNEQLQKEVESRGRIITQLRQASDRSVYPSQQPSGTGNDQGLRDVIAQLQEKLRKAEEFFSAESEAREAKYTTLLNEQRALNGHLQAELDEVLNLMPVDQGSSRIVDDDDEMSREISRFYDDGLDQIITELHGTGESPDFESAADEAETSLRQAAEEAGWQEPLDKATLAAFGIRQLRSEHDLLKRLLIESEGRVKELMQANDELARRGEHVKENIGALEGEREAIKRTVAEAEERAMRHSAELDSVKAKLAEADRRVRQLTLEKGELGKRNHEVEEQLKTTKGDIATFQRLVNDTKRLNEILKTQYAEGEARARDFEGEILGLRRQLAEERGHVGVVENETLALRQQIAELEENLTALENSKEALEAKVKGMVGLENELESLKSKIQELQSTEEVDNLNRQVREMERKLKLVEEQLHISKDTIGHLQQSLFNTEQATRKLASEKEGLRSEVEKAAAECRASRGRFAQLLHDNAEKEAKWATSKQNFETQIHRQESVLELVFDEIQDPAALTGTTGSQPAMLIEALKRRLQAAADAEEKTKRYKGAAKKWLGDFEKSKAQVETLTAEVRELRLNLKAEKKSSDEKMAQLILALRRD